jgi:hypothetical protein
LRGAQYQNLLTKESCSEPAKSQSTCFCYNPGFNATFLMFPYAAQPLKRAATGLLAVSLLFALGACGGDDDENTGPPTSGIAKRVYVSNAFRDASVLHIVDAEQDRASSRNISIGFGTLPTLMAVTPDKSKTLVFTSADNALAVVNNVDETVAGRIALGDWTESFVVLPDNRTVYAAVRNRSLVLVLDITNGMVSAEISIPTPRRLALTPNGAKVLVFSDDEPEPNTLRIINTADRSVVAVSGDDFDHPVGAVFTADSASAFIVNCGPQCGGAAAKIVRLDLTTNMPSGFALVDAATTALLDGSNLYAAGTAGDVGKLTVVDTSSMSPGAPVTIGNGFHHRMQLAGGKLFIGARTCAETRCLTIFNISSGTAKITESTGDVTGIQPIPERNVVYVVQGGEFDIYDTTTESEIQPAPTIVGRASDVIAIF